jgi:hypothetical protein
MFGTKARLEGAFRPPFFAGGYPKIIALRATSQQRPLPIDNFAGSH